jgi:hypothetical protein
VQNASKDASATRAKMLPQRVTMPAQQQWKRQRDKGNAASKHNKDKDDSATRAKTPPQGQQRHPCN